MIRIGVTGHRVLAELDKIEAGVEAALRRIEETFPGEPLQIFSSLAEGADRIVARLALARPGSTLIVPMPFAESMYVEDFPTEASRAEFAHLLGQAKRIELMPDGLTREQAYEAAGDYVLNNSDVVIAVWDGQVAQGSGGTGDIVTRARDRRKPIAWVHAGNRLPGTLSPTTLSDEQGRVTFETL